ncbi:MAG: NUDIX hydrolase [Proteobacteria bacterium]|nr:NUDIX hydrolase [Pseudomonadota bacterium]
MPKSDPPDLDWTIVRQHPVKDYHIFRIGQHDAAHPLTGEIRTFSVIAMPDWVNVVAITPGDEIVLVRQYRHGSARQTLEIPGGLIEKDESVERAARRELREETGYEAEDWHEIGVVEPNPALQTNRCYTMLARGARQVADLDPDPGEVIAVEHRPLADIHTMVKSGEIIHAMVVAAFYHLHGYLQGFGG